MPQYIGYSFEVSLKNSFVFPGLTFYERNFVSKITLKTGKLPQQPRVLLASQPLVRPNLLPQVSSGLSQRSSSQPHRFLVLQRTQTLRTQGLVHLAKTLPNLLLAIRKRPLEIQAFSDRHNPNPNNNNNNRKILLVRPVHLANQHNQRNSSQAYLVAVEVLLPQPANPLLRPLVVVSWSF